LYEYTIKELKFSQGAAYRRLQTMRLLKDLPLNESKIADGRLPLSTIAKVQTSMGKETPENRQVMLDKLEGKSSREVDRELASKQPKGSREFTRWLSSEEVQLTFSMEKECFCRMQELLSLRTHVDVQKTYKILFKDLIDVGQEKWNPLRRSKPSPARTSCIRPDQIWKTVPPNLRKEVWTRDQNICSYKNPETGARCSTRDLLQIDHIHPLALGGKNELSNLRLLCAAHNRARARETYPNFNGKGDRSAE
jgi:5-methylcytosine-specific restriction endonuclease McrA